MVLSDDLEADAHKTKARGIGTEDYWSSHMLSLFQGAAL